MSDLYFNKMGNVMVVAPTPHGLLQHLVEYKEVGFGENTEAKPALTRWIFADFPMGTLTDEWGNAYDHQVHSLLSGSLEEGQRFLEMLNEFGCIPEEANDFFVPFQKLDINSIESSDGLREEHPRAFTLSRRAKQSISAIVTSIRDSLVLK